MTHDVLPRPLMMRSELPRPVTLADVYLHDIALSLRVLVDMQAAQLAISSGKVAVSSLSSSGGVGGQGTPLPAGFPGSDLLHEAGIETLEDVPRSARRLKEIPGVGPATATEILKALPKKS